ncbi:MAG: beta-galactosidase [Defluviitaleaceae bacterium]|nr:beta-galactosidase [Defluviitaleaceae bacterium]
MSKQPYLISGEFHYFRVPKEDWAHRLDLLVQSGAAYAATYIPWMLHEPTEGDFRFSSSEFDDLEGFLDLCREKGIDVIARPGPYQYSELRYCGLPPWLCENHPEIMAQDKDGKAYNNFAVSYLHPLFLEKTKNWFDQVLPILARHMKSRGGAIAYVQIDNEMCFHEWFGGWDYHREVMLPHWAEYKKQNPAAEYHEFYFHSVGKFAGILAQWMRDDGINCTLMHNAANPNMVPYFRDTIKAVDEDFLLGVDMYFNLGMDFEANNPTPIFAANGFLGFEQLRLMGYVPMVLEMQAGNCADWPPTTPTNLMCWYNTCLAMGMKGVNWYVFTGGPNPPGIGGDGDIYDYNAAVGPLGEVRPIYDVLRKFSDFIRENPWLMHAEMEYDYLLGHDWAHSRSKNDAWNLLRKGVLITGFCTSYTPKLVELASLNQSDKPLVICTSRKMPRKIQDNIIKFIQKGGKVLIAPLVPRLDENEEEYTALADFLGAGFSEVINASVDFCYGELTNIAINKAYTVTAADSRPLAYDKFSGKQTAWEKDFPGGGKVICLGMSWKHSKDIHMDMFRSLMMRLDCTDTVVSCDNPYVWAVVRFNGKNRCLFVMNLFASPMEANITLIGRVQLAPMETKIVFFNNIANQFDPAEKAPQSSVR